MVQKQNRKSCHSDQYLAQIQIAAATNTATGIGVRCVAGGWISPND